MSFDTPFLKAEFERLSNAIGRIYQFPPPGTCEVDAMRIFHSKERASWNGPGNGDDGTSTTTGQGSVTAGGICSVQLFLILAVWTGSGQAHGHEPAFL